MPTENEKKKQWRSENVHVPVLITVAGDRDGDGDEDLRGRYGDGYDCCGDGVGTGTKSEILRGRGGDGDFKHGDGWGRGHERVPVQLSSKYIGHVRLYVKTFKAKKSKVKVTAWHNVLAAMKILEVRNE